MTQIQPIVDPPPPRAFVVNAILTILALILLLLGFTTPGLVVLALAVVSSLYNLYAKLSGPGSKAGQSPVERQGGSQGGSPEVR